MSRFEKHEFGRKIVFWFVNRSRQVRVRNVKASDRRGFLRYFIIKFVFSPFATFVVCVAVMNLFVGPLLADSYTTYYGPRDKKVGTSHSMNTGRVQGNPNAHPPSTDAFQGQSYESLMGQAISAYENGAYKHAEEMFRYLGSDLRPGELEPKIWRVKALAQKLYFENKSRGHDQAHEMATSEAMAMCDIYKRTMDNSAFDALKKRFESEKEPFLFDLEGHRAYELGKEAFDKEEFKSAASHLAKVVERDPHSYDGWFYWAHSEFWANGGDKKKLVQIWQNGQKYHSQFKTYLNSMN